MRGVLATSPLVLSEKFVKRGVDGKPLRPRRRIRSLSAATPSKEEGSDEAEHLPDTDVESFDDGLGLNEADLFGDEDVVESEMALGAQGDALLAALNASLGGKIDGVSTQVAAVAGRVEGLERTTAATNRTVESQGAQLSALDLRMSKMERGQQGGSRPGSSGFCGGPDPWLGSSFGHGPALNASTSRPGGSSVGGGSSNGRPESVFSGGAGSVGDGTDLGDVMRVQYGLPVKRRRIVVLGGFPRNTERQHIVDKLKEVTLGVELCLCLGDYNNKGKWLFRTNADAWAMMKAMAGRKYSITLGGESITLWHGFDKSENEQLLARRVSLCHRTLKEYFVSKRLCEASADWKWLKENLMDSDSETGVVYVKTQTGPEAPKITYDISRKDGDGKIKLRTAALDRVTTILTQSKGEQFAKDFGTAVCNAIEPANAISKFSGDGK